MFLKVQLLAFWTLSIVLFYILKRKIDNVQKANNPIDIPGHKILHIILKSRRILKFSRLNKALTKSRSWLRHYATSLKVASSIPDEVTGLFNLPNPSSRTMALRSTQPLTEMSTRKLPGGKGGPARKADNLTAVCEPII
jgi:hypothetical protein